jgi:hypothetical protein
MAATRQEGATRMAAGRGRRQQGDGNPSRRRDADDVRKGTAATHQGGAMRMAAGRGIVATRGRRQQGDGGNKGMAARRGRHGRSV